MRSWIAGNEAPSTELAVIISNPTSASGIIVFATMLSKYRKQKKN